MGAKIIVICAVVLTLCGCTKVVAVPFVYVSEGVYAGVDAVWDDGVIRDRTPTDVPALQYITDESGINLTPGELVDYNGTLYSLSNYRALLLRAGYTVEREKRTCDILDTTLFDSGDRVRLIYQSSGRIRILFENQKGAAHILLEGVI